MDLMLPHIAETAIKRVIGEFSSDSHNIFTPFALCNEVIDKIPSLDGQVLVVANLEFVYNMIVRGVDKERLYFATPCEKKGRLVTAWIPKSNIIIYKDVLTEQDVNGMKFDVVCGNPPYQDPHEKNRKIWKEFVISGFSVLKAGGSIAFVTPNNWTADVDKLYQKFFLNKTPLHINLNECARHFPNISTPFTYYIIKNEAAPIDHTTRIVSRDIATGDITSTNMNLNNVFPSFLPTHISQPIVSILEKTLFSNDHKFPLYRNCAYHTDLRKKGVISEKQSSVYNIPVLYSYENTQKPARYYWAKDPHPKQQGVRLVIWSRPAAYDNMRVTTDSTTEGFFHLPLTPQEEPNAVDVLTKKIYKFILFHMTPGLNLLTPVMKNLPAVDLTRSWTDAELYAHFNLTPEEIKLIEDTIK